MALFDKLLNLIYPARCIGCERVTAGSSPICKHCSHAVFAVEPVGCVRCGKPAPTAVGAIEVQRAHECYRCRRTNRYFDKARQFWEYSSVIRDALVEAKYGPSYWRLRSLGRLISKWLVDQIAKRQTERHRLSVTAVPMHRRRLKRRGLNHAHLLAKFALAGTRFAPVETGLVRKVRRTRPQSSLGFGRRRANLRGAFEVPRPERVEDRHVVIVDDVFTTGTTASELARIIKGAGAKRVDIFTACRTIQIE